MEPAFTNFWIDLATNAPFVAFLLYMWHSQRKDLQEYKKEIRELRKEGKEEEQRIRDRFGEVIIGLQTDKAELVKSVEAKLADLDSKTSSLEKGIKRLFSMLERMKEQINELKIKEEVRQLNR